MNILALDTTGPVASVAVVDETKTVCEFTTNHTLTHSQTIMPMVDQMLRMAELTMEDIDCIACSQGPGSFTGLRIGAATAKALAHGTGKKLVPVPTLDALAYNGTDTEKCVVPIMDARRNQVYTAFYTWEQGNMKRLTSYMAEPMETVLQHAEAYERGVLFTGDGVLPFREAILRHGHRIASSHLRMQRAASVGALAFSLLEQAVHYAFFEPIYLRKPQAEREYDEKRGEKA